MTERVVDHFEPIKVYVQNREPTPVGPGRALMRVRDHCVEHRAIRDARQSIVGSQEADALLGDSFCIRPIKIVESKRNVFRQPGQ
jgi:hypothetical protein